MWAVCSCLGSRSADLLASLLYHLPFPKVWSVPTHLPPPPLPGNQAWLRPGAQRGGRGPAETAAIGVILPRGWREAGL